MKALSGIISDRLRKLLGSGGLDGLAINPGRPGDAAPPRKAPKPPKGVEGHKMTGRKRR